MCSIYSCRRVIILPAFENYSLTVLGHSHLPAIQWGRYYFHPYFIDEETEAQNNQAVFPMGFRTGYPQIQNFGILSILRNLRNSMCKEDFLTFPKSRSQDPLVRGALPIPGGKEHPYLHRQREGKRNLNEQTLLFAPLLHLAHTLFCLVILFHGSPRFIKTSIKTLRYNSFLGSSFPYESSVSCHVKLIVNKFVCFSFVNLLLLQRPQLRT